MLHSHLEYRLYDGRLVAYDRLLEMPQWRVELSDVTETESSREFLDRLPGITLKRLFIRTDDNTKELVGLTNADSVRDRVNDVRLTGYVRRTNLN